MGNKNSIAAVLAIMAMAGFLIMFGVLGFLTVPPTNRDFLNTGLIALISFVSTAFGYYLGSSVSSARKNELLAQSVVPPMMTEDLQPGFTSKPANNDGSARLPLLALMALFMAVALLPACATMQKESPQIAAGKSLLAVKSTITTAATAANSLCLARQLPADTCMEAAAAYALAKPAYDTAVDAYLLMSQGGDPAAFGAALMRVQNIAGNMLQLTGGAK